MMSSSAVRYATTTLLVLGSAATSLAQPSPSSDPADITNFVHVSAGAFVMGSADAGGNAIPVHGVTLTLDFEIGKYEVTQAQWESVMGRHPSHFGGPLRPVEQVSWVDVQSFLQAMNMRGDGYTYRLPTEAEWEYSARAGTTGDYGGTGELDQMGWYSQNSNEETHPVGRKEPNAWGLYDMHGNVWEWVHDWYDIQYYARSPTTDPTGPDIGTARVCRGGGWSYSAARSKSASRAHPAPDARQNFIGFRLVRTRS